MEKQFFKIFIQTHIIYIPFLVVCLIGGLATSSCSPSKQEIKESVDELTTQKSVLEGQLKSITSQYGQINAEVNSLQEKLNELKIYESGKTPKYILKIHLKQSHFSLSISKHLKDAMNAIDFEIPTDKEFYESVSVGTEIVDKFRIGSCILYGSFGDWKMTVNGKEIRNN